MTSYIIKSILCSGLLLLFYHLFLEGEKMHRFNRFYLLFSIAFSLTVPLMSFEIQTDKLPESLSYSVPDVKVQEALSNSLPPTLSNVKIKQNSIPDHLPQISYALISVLLFLRFFKNTRTILITKKKQKTIAFHGAKLILLPHSVVTYTFLNNIFITESDYNRNHFEDEILTHELAHVHQKHTLDVLFIEFIKSLFWINPLWLLYKKAIQLNHEFLADEAVLNKFPNLKSYQLLLLDKILYTRQVSLTSSFNYSITKKRLAMMTKNTSRKRRIIKQTAISLFTFCLTFVFCEKIYSQADKTVLEKDARKTDIRPSQTEVDTHSKKQLTGPGLNQKELSEFNQAVKENFIIVKKTNNAVTYKTLHFGIEEKKRMYVLYIKMSKEQQQTAEVHFFERPAPVKSQPSLQIFESWKNPNMFGVWIDGKKVNNKALEQYKASDIAEWWSSYVYANARKGKIYKYQLDLTTNKKYGETYDERMNDRITYALSGKFTFPI